MIKKHLLLLILCFGALSIQAQKPSIGTNTTFRTSPFSDMGVGMDGIMPIGRRVFFTPEVNFFLSKEHFRNGYKITSGSVAYGMNAHYAIRFRNSNSFISPFVGLGGQTIWNEYLTRDYSQDKEDKSKFSNVDKEGTSTYPMANVGLSWKWFMGELFYINTQARYSKFLNNVDANYFSFSIGIGFVFDLD